MTVLLDSHVVLWWAAAENTFLSRRARTTLRDARALLVSPISCWEIALLAERGRVRIDKAPHAWIQDLFEIDRVDLAPLSAVAAVSAAQLGEDFPGDPADRLLYASARDLGVPLMTRDRAIHEYAHRAGDVRVIW